jgi:hypothetical protein
MEPKIKRKFRSFSFSLATSVASATSVRFDDVAGGCIFVPAGGTAVTSIDVWTADNGTATHGRLFKDGSGVSVALSQDASNARVYPLPDEAFSVGSVRLVGNNAVATTLVCTVMLKG